MKLAEDGLIEGPKAGARKDQKGSPGAELMPLPKRRWADVKPPKGWAPVAKACRAVAGTLPDLARRIMDRVYLEVPGFREGPLPQEDVFAGAFKSAELMLVGTAERKDPAERDIRERLEVGRLWAAEGVPLDLFLKSLQIGYRETWKALAEQLAKDPAATALIPDAGEVAMQWTHQLTATLATAHRQVHRNRDMASLQRGQRLHDALTGARRDPGTAAEEAAWFGFDPEGSFVAVSVRASKDLVDDWDRIQHALREPSGTNAVIGHRDGLFILSQNTDVEWLVEILRSLLPEVALGIGVERRGLDGAGLSIEDAEQAAATAGIGETSRFEDDWLTATALDAGERLLPLLSRGFEVAEKNPHFAETIRAYMDLDFSKVRTAQRLYIHTHTVVYRLDRWKALTGWDMSTAHGLMMTMTAIKLFDSLRSANEQVADVLPIHP